MTTFLMILSVLAILYGVVSMISPSMKGPNIPKGRLSLILGVIVFILSYGYDNMVVRIDGQHVGVIQGISGVKEDELQPGIKIIMPWDKVELMDITEQVYTFSSAKQEGSKSYSDAIWAATKDLNISVNDKLKTDSTSKIGMKVGIDISISWRIKLSEASWIYKNIAESDVDPNTNTRYIWISENIIRNKTKSVVSDVIKNYSPENCIIQREDIQQIVFDKLNKEVADRRIEVFQVNIREIFYDPNYEKKINDKKLNELEALNQKEITKQIAEKELQASKNKNIAITFAQGEAEALRIKGNAIKENPGIKDLQWIEAWKAGGSQVPHTLITGDNQKSSFLMNLGDAKK